MLQSRFESLQEQLLRAGVAPRHVRRYVSELGDHFDDLVREETANGVPPRTAEIKARTRLGSDGDLAEMMIMRPELRSLSARYPWAVFGIGPVAMVVGALAVALIVEIPFLAVAHAVAPHPSAALRGTFVFWLAVWNTLVTFGAPLGIAAALCIVGLKQRIAPGWIFAGIAIACILGAFQEIHFTDDGRHGELSLGTALIHPYPMKLFVRGLYRCATTLALAGGFYWAARRSNTSWADREVAMQAVE